MSGPKYYHYSSPYSGSSSTSTYGRSTEVSGPKFYDFSASSPEEAAGIVSRFSSFGGIRATVSGNRINVEVSSAAWYAGKDYSYISEQIRKATERFRADQEMARLLAEGKKEEKARIAESKKNIRKQADEKRRQYRDARTRCSALSRETDVSVHTPFGDYDMKSDVLRCEALSEKLRAEAGRIDGEEKKCRENCDKYMEKVEQCTTLTELSRIRAKAPAMSVSHEFAGKEVDALETEVRERKARLLAFTESLREIDRIIGEKGLSDFRSRIEQAVRTLDPFSPDSVREIIKTVGQIEREHAYMREESKIARSDAEALRLAEAQNAALKELKEVLQPLAERAEVHAETKVDYERLGREAVTACEEILAETEKLSYRSSYHACEIELAREKLAAKRTMLRSPQVYAQLTDLLTKLRALLEDCRKDAENYDAFYAEYTRYQQLYMQFRAVMSADKASMEDKDGYLEEPAEIVFEFSDPEKQRQSLAERNQQLELLVHQAMQHGFCAGLSAVLGKSAWGKEFKSERLRDGSAHVTYVRKGDFGAIYDISYDAEGRVSMCPRGVILSNGRSLISPEALNGIYESCDWAKEISDAFSQIGLCDGACEEMPEEVRRAMLDSKNYYVLKTEEESVRYLRMHGYTDEQIAALGYAAEPSSQSGDGEEEKRTAGAAGARELRP